jgi:quercetin dioxygenase-like cupin family protein
MTGRPRAVATRHVDDERVIVTEWRLAPGAETGWHVHAFDYVVVYRTAAKHIVETRDGLRAVDMPEGASYRRARGVEHNVINAGANEVILVEIELK